MKVSVKLAIIVFTSIQLFSCNRDITPENALKEGGTVEFLSVNQKFPNYRYIVSGDVVSDKLDIHLNKAYLEDSKRCKKVLYRLADADQAVLSMYGKYYKNAWSPSGDYLLLPLSPDQGFGVFKVDDTLIDKVKNLQYDDKFRIDNKSIGSHIFLKWFDDNSFMFKFERSTDDYYIYDLRNKMLFWCIKGKPRKTTY